MNEFQMHFFLIIISVSSVNTQTKWFPMFGRMVEVPLKTNGKMTWKQAVSRCHSIGGRPFIPNNKTEFQWMESHHSIGGFNSWGGATMWFPATDANLEGRLIFTDGKGLDIHGDAMLWRNNEIMQQNSDAYDCVGYRTDNAAYMYDCTADRFPMICEKDIDPTATPPMTDCVPIVRRQILSSINGDPITLFAPSSASSSYSGVIKVYYGPTWESSRILPMDLSKHAQQIGNGIMMLSIWPRFLTRSITVDTDHFSFYLTTNRSDSERYDNFIYEVDEEELLLELKNMGDSVWYQNCYPEPTTLDITTEPITIETDSCSSPFEMLGSQCLYVGDNDSTWQEAQEKCQNMNGNLAEVVDEQQSVINFLKTKKGSWAWAWIARTNVSNSKQWLRSQLPVRGRWVEVPDDTYDGCLKIGVEYGGFKPLPCTNRLGQYICEKKSTSQTTQTKSTQDVTSTDPISDISITEGTSGTSQTKVMLDVTPTEAISHIRSESTSQTTQTKSTQDVTSTDPISDISITEGTSGTSETKVMQDVTPTEAISHIRSDSSKAHTNSLIIGITVILLLSAIIVVSYIYVKKRREKVINRDSSMRYPEGERNMNYKHLKDGLIPNEQ